MTSAKKKLQNITFSADPALIAAARKRAKFDQTTLNDAFRAWLELFVRPISSADDYAKLMHGFKGVLSGARFSRDDANER